MTEPFVRSTSNFNKFLSVQEESEPVYVSREFGNQKWQVVQKYEKRFFDENGLKLSEWMDQEIAVPVKSGPHRTVYRVRFDDETFYLKHLKTIDWKRQLRSVFSRAQSLREFHAASLVRQSGLSTIQPVAVGWKKEGLFVKNSYLISKEIADAEPLDVFVFKTLRRMSHTQQCETKRQLAFDLGQLAGCLHRMGFLHRDFHAGNILIRTKTPNFGKLFLIDLHALGTRLPITSRRRRNNLGLLHNFFSHFISHTDRLRFFRSYWQSLTLAESSHTNKAEFIEEIRKTDESCHQVLETAFRKSDKKWFRPNRRLFIENNSQASSRGLTWLDDRFRQRIKTDPQDILSHIPDAEWKTHAEGFDIVNWKLDLENEQIAVCIRRAKSSLCSPKSNRENRWSNLRTCWENAHRLLRRGFESPRPLFLYETTNANLWSYLLMEPLRNVVPLEIWWKKQERNILKLSSFLEKFHRFGFEVLPDPKQLPLGYSETEKRFVVTNPCQIRFTRKSQTSPFSFDELSNFLTITNQSSPFFSH